MESQSRSTYIGNELELFEKADTWKRYVRSHIASYLKGDVLEVGAGIGGTTQKFCSGSENSWTCLEPDPVLAAEIEKKIKAKELPSNCAVATAYLADTDTSCKFDAILYIDVIEHIEDDRSELSRAAEFLKPGGVLIILVPAHQFLFSEFDKKIGHFRRYSKTMLAGVMPTSLKQVQLKYLDGVGMLSSMANRYILKSELPTRGQINFWDKVIVPFSKVLDRITFYSLGKSVLGVWRNEK